MKNISDYEVKVHGTEVRCKITVVVDHVFEASYYISLSNDDNSTVRVIVCGPSDEITKDLLREVLSNVSEDVLLNAHEQTAYFKWCKRKSHAK